MSIELPDLPFPEHALEPYISERTVRFHYHKHHAGYVKKTKDALPPERRKLPLEEIIAKAEGSLFNNAAQVWNHTFYWNSLTPQDCTPGGTLSSMIDDGFGSLDAFKQAFAREAGAAFGSGWTWLVLDPADDKLSIVTTSNAQTPLTTRKVPLLTLDVWEHAYYLDYQNDRAAYIEAFLDHLANWEEASRRLELARPARRRAAG